MNNKRGKIIKWSKWMVLLSAYIWAFTTIFPFSFMMSSSFKQSSEVFANGIFSLPEYFSLANYAEVLERRLGIYFKDSGLTLLLFLAGILVISSLVSYVFVRLESKQTSRLLVAVAACMSIPIHIAFIPVFILIQKFHTYNIIFGLVGPYTMFYLPISISILSGFMKGVPKGLEGATLINGCSYYQIFARIILPLSEPGIATIVIYNSVYVWNEFGFVLILTSSMKGKTLPLAISDSKGEYTMNVSLIMTVLTLCAIPMIIASCIGQDKLVEGMMTGAVKG